MDTGRRPPRAIGLAGATLLNLNAVVGAGIFALPALLYAGAGSLAPLAIFAFAALTATSLALFGKLSTLFNQSGGVQLYVEHALGRFAGFQAGLGIIGANTAARAANFHVLVSYLAAIFPVFDDPVIRMAAILALIASFTMIAISGTRRYIATLWFGTALKLSPILLLCVAGLVMNGVPTTYIPPEFSQVEATALLLAYAFSGGGAATISAGETKDPHRAIFQSMMINVAIVAALYTLVVLAYVAIAPSDANADRPLASAADAVFGPWGGIMISVAAIFSIATGQLTYFVAMPRLLYGMGRRGLLTARLVRLSPRFDTPWVAIAVYGALVMALAASGTFRTLATLMVAVESLLVLAGIASFIVVWQRNSGGIAATLGLRWAAMAAISTIFTIWLMLQLPASAVIPTLGIIAFGAVAYLFARSSAKDGEPIAIRPV